MAGRACWAGRWWHPPILLRVKAVAGQLAIDTSNGGRVCAGVVVRRVMRRGACEILRGLRPSDPAPLRGNARLCGQVGLIGAAGFEPATFGPQTDAALAWYQSRYHDGLLHLVPEDL